MQARWRTDAGAWRLSVLALRIFVILSLACSVAPSGSAQRQATAERALPAGHQRGGTGRWDAATDVDIARFMESRVAAAVVSDGIPGATLVIVRDGRVIFSRAYGFADAGTARPVDTGATLFRQGSISKVLIWILALQMAQEGRLDLDRDVNEYLHFTVSGPPGGAITMRHLMTHTAGFAERYWGVFEPGAGTDTEDELRAALPARPYAPGETMAYSNYGAALAAQVIENVAGRSFDWLANDRIFRPLGMARSTLLQPPSNNGELALANAPGGRGPAPFETVGTPAAGALSAPADDMARLLAALIPGERLDTRLLEPSTLTSAFALQRSLAPRLKDGFGLGFMVGEHNGVRYAGHTGDLIAFVSDLRILPDHGVGWHVAFSGSGRNGHARRLRDDLARAFIERFFHSDRLQSPVREAAPTVDLSGTYLSTRRARSGPVLIGEPLRMLQIQGSASGELLVRAPWLASGPRRFAPIDHDLFAEEETGTRLAVIRSADGRPARIASAFLDRAAVFERAPFLMRPAFAALLIALCLLAAIVAIQLIRQLVRWRRPAGEGARIARCALLSAACGCWILVAAAGVGLFFSYVDADTTYFYSADRARLASAIAALSILPASIVMSLDAAVVWMSAEHRLERSARLGAAGAALVVAVCARYFDLTQLSTDY